MRPKTSMHVMQHAAKLQLQRAGGLQRTASCRASVEDGNGATSAAPETTHTIPQKLNATPMNREVHGVESVWGMSLHDCA